MEYNSLGSGRTVDPNTENEDKSGDAESSQYLIHGDQNPGMDVTYYRKKLVKINQKPATRDLQQDNDDDELM